MKPFTSAFKIKGWTRDTLAKRWKITPRQLSNISANPKQKDWDALAGIPDKTNN